MLIEVTLTDIMEGTQRDCARCPVSRAIQRAAGLMDFNCTVGLSTVLIGNDANWTSIAVGRTIDLPKIACDFIVNYDAGRARLCLPFSFDLPIDSLNPAA